MIFKKIPRVGVEVIIKKDNKILLGKRKGSHGAGTWAFPGGHLEFGETIFDCAKREINEEVGIKIKNLKHGPYTEDYFKEENKHYITIFVISDYESGEVKVKEPNYSEDLEWFDWNNMPDKLFLPIINLKLTEFRPF
jgi:8-oxo-dGTP diphosphatase